MYMLALRILFNVLELEVGVQLEMEGDLTEPDSPPPDAYFRMEFPSPGLCRLRSVLPIPGCLLSYSKRCYSIPRLNVRDFPMNDPRNVLRTARTK